MMSCTMFFFFFQAEDGIRDYKVTGVQTCALPISLDRPPRAERRQRRPRRGGRRRARHDRSRHSRRRRSAERSRSEERRVGKEGRDWWLRDHLEKTKE